MNTTAVLFPFDLFGSGGAGAGASLVADELREMLADARRETVPTRAAAWVDRLRLHETSFDTPDDYQAWRATGRKLARRVLRRDDFLLWVGGNHLAALPLYDELANDDDTLVVQLDAHLDIHHFADCLATLSHGNFLLHVEGRMPPLVNVGHRELLLPVDHVARTYRTVHSAEDLVRDPAKVLAGLRAQCRKAKRVVLDLDCDVLDAAYFPAVARPVPFGLTPQQVLAVLDAAWGDNVIALAVSEFDPARDQGDRSLALLVWLLEWVLLRRHETGGS